MKTTRTPLAAMVVAALLAAPHAHAASIGKNSFAKGGVTRSGSSAFATGTRGTPRSKFGGTSGSRGDSAFSRSMSSTPRSKFAPSSGSRGDSTFSKSMRTTSRNPKFPGGNGNSEGTFSRNLRATPNGKFPNSDLKPKDTQFSDSMRTTPKSEFKPDVEGDPEFSDSSSSTVRRKFAGGENKSADPAFDDDLRTSVTSDFPLNESKGGSSTSGTAGERRSVGPREFSRERAPARPRGASARGVTIGGPAARPSTRGVAVGASRRARALAISRASAGRYGRAPADGNGGTPAGGNTAAAGVGYALDQLPVAAERAIPIVSRGQTYYRLEGQVIRELRRGADVSYVIEGR